MPPALWMPSPPRDGDPVYCEGARVGTFHGDYARPGYWYVMTGPLASMPPLLRAKIEACRMHIP